MRGFKWISWGNLSWRVHGSVGWYCYRFMHSLEKSCQQRIELPVPGAVWWNNFDVLLGMSTRLAAIPRVAWETPRLADPSLEWWWSSFSSPLLPFSVSRNEPPNHRIPRVERRLIKLSVVGDDNLSPEICISHGKKTVSHSRSSSIQKGKKR